MKNKLVEAKLCSEGLTVLALCLTVPLSSNKITIYHCLSRLIASMMPLIPLYSDFNHQCFSPPPSIGYPVVTLGFGFKSYVSYKMRLRKQKEVQKENEFYMQLLQQALPPEQQMLQRQEREAEEGETHTHTVTVNCATDASATEVTKHGVILTYCLSYLTSVKISFSFAAIKCRGT